MIVLKNPEKLKIDITSNGNTMTSIAQRLGFTKAYISSIISGTRNPNEKVSIGICELLGKQFEDYFFIRSVNK